MMKQIIITFIITFSQCFLEQSGDYHHSLDKEANDFSRLSAYPYQVPPMEVKIQQRKFDDETFRVAFKMAKYYREVFEFIDEDADEWIESKEIEVVYKNYNWPVLQGKTPQEMVPEIMEKFGTKKRGNMDFIEFCGMMEYLWSLKALNEFQQCKIQIQDWLETIGKVFDFIDLDKKKAVDIATLKKGLDKFLGSDIPEDNFKELLKLVSYEKPDDTLNVHEWVIGIAQNLQFADVNLDELKNS